MFGLIKKCFFTRIMFFGCNVLNLIALECVSMNNQECRIRPEIINVNSNELLLYPYRVKISKCSGSCDKINNTYAKLCVSDVAKNINVKVFNLMSRTNEARPIEWHETCQSWNNDKCRCECKELIDRGICDIRCIWNPSNCDCECDKSCDVGEYLNYENCKCRNKLVDKLVEECIENIDRNDMIYNETLN